MKKFTGILLFSLLVATASFGQTATVLFKEQVDTEAEVEGILTDVTDVITNNDAAGGDLSGSYPSPVVAVDVIDLDNINQGNTLAGDPVFLVDECFHVATPTGGGFICEGSTADANEMLFLFPDLNEADSTHIILTESATASVTNKTMVGASNTINLETLTIQNVLDNEVAVGDGAGSVSYVALQDCVDGSESLDWNGSAFVCNTITAGSGDNVSIDGVAAVDPDFRSEGDVDTIRCTGAGAPDASCVAAEDVIFRVVCTDCISDAEVVDTLTASNYLPLAGGVMTGDITLSERSSDPANPAEGKWVCWMSDGTGSGDDGDVLCKITAAAVTKTLTLFDFSAVP